MTQAPTNTQNPGQTGPLKLRTESQAGGASSSHVLQTLAPGQVTKVKAQKGERYKVVREAEANQASQVQEPLLADAVVATREGDDLHLRYADNTRLLLEGFFPACQDGQCAAILPGNEAGGMAISGASPSGISAATGSGRAQLVYAYGLSDELRATLQGLGRASSGSGFSEGADHQR